MSAFAINVCVQAGLVAAVWECPSLVPLTFVLSIVTSVLLARVHVRQREQAHVAMARVRR